MVDGYTFNYRGEEVEASDEGIFSEGITELVVENKFGNLEIATAKGEAGWSWSKKVWGETPEMAEIFLDQVNLDVQTEGTTQTMKLVLPEHDPDFNGVKSHLVLNVPVGIKAKLINGHGNVEASNLDGEFELENRHGNVELTDLSGSIITKNSHGNFAAKNIGPAMIKVSHGNADVLGGSGNLEITSSHGSVRAGDIAGDANVSGSHSNISLTKISGNVSTKTSHAKTNIDNINVAIDNPKFTSIDLATTHASIDISIPSSSNPAIDMKTTHGSTSTDFDTEGGSQPVNLRSTHGSITVKKTSGIVEVVE
jgi:type 1 fimbria pilin